MRHNISLRVACILLLSVLLSSLCLLNNVAYANKDIIGKTYECLFSINDKGDKVFIRRAEDRPKVSFTGAQTCIYNDNFSSTYTVNKNRIMVLEYGIFPIYTFIIEGDKLKLDGLGILANQAYTYDQYFYDTSSSEHNNYATQYASQNSYGHISDISDGFNVFCWFQNGYAALCTSKGYLSYITPDGNMAIPLQYKLGYSNAPFAAGSESFLVIDNNTKKRVLINHNGKELISFDKAEKIGCISEGSIMVLDKTQTLQGEVFSLAYYDEKGNEILRFDDKYDLGGASNFSGGRAFIGEKEGNSQVKNIEMIDKQGNSIAINAMRVNDISRIESFEIEYISSFAPGEEYASMQLSCGPAYISKSGDITLLPEKYSGYNVETQLYNNVLILSEYGYGESFYFIEDDKLIKPLDLPELKGAKNSQCYYLANGNFFVIVQTGNRTYFSCVLDIKGNIIEGPVEGFIYREDEYGVGGFISLCRYCLVSGLGRYRDIIEQDRMIKSERRYKEITGERTVRYGDSMFYYDRAKTTYGLVDDKGNTLVEPTYFNISCFIDGYAIANDKAFQQEMVDCYGNILFLDSKGNVVDYINLKENVSNTSSTTPIAKKDDIAKCADLIAKTDTAFQRATNLALLPQVGGEICGYLYDIAKFDLFGLVSHIYTDVTKQYQQTAADIIIRSLLYAQSEQEFNDALYCITAELRALNQDCFNDLSSKTKLIDIVTFKNASEIKQFDNFSKLVETGKVLSDLIDSQSDLTLNARLTIFLVHSGYLSSKTYLKESIAQSGNDPEMKAIYQIALDKLDEAYKLSIEKSAEYYIKKKSEVIKFENYVDAIELATQYADYDIVDTMIKEAGRRSGSKYLSPLMWAHSAVSFIGGEILKGDDTYESMQLLYENAIVLNSLTKDINNAYNAYISSPNEENEKNLRRKAIALGQYRLITLDNLDMFRKSNLSGDYALSEDLIKGERNTINTAIGFLREQ